MAVARHSNGLRDPLVLLGAFENHALAHLAEIVALDLLPWSLRGGILIPAGRLKLLPTALPFGVVHQRVGAAGDEVDAYPIAGLEQRQPAARSRFGGGVEDRGTARRPRLPPVADAGKTVNALFDQIRGR